MISSGEIYGRRVSRAAPINLGLTKPDILWFDEQALVPIRQNVEHPSLGSRWLSEHSSGDMFTLDISRGVLSPEIDHAIEVSQGGVLEWQIRFVEGAFPDQISTESLYGRIFASLDLYFENSAKPEISSVAGAAIITNRDVKSFVFSMADEELSLRSHLRPGQLEDDGISYRIEENNNGRFSLTRNLEEHVAPEVNQETNARFQLRMPVIVETYGNDVVSIRDLLSSVHSWDPQEVRTRLNILVKNRTTWTVFDQQTQRRIQLLDIVLPDNYRRVIPENLQPSRTWVQGVLALFRRSSEASESERTRSTYRKNNVPVGTRSATSAETSIEVFVEPQQGISLLPVRALGHCEFASKIPRIFRTSFNRIPTITKWFVRVFYILVTECGMRLELCQEVQERPQGN